MGDQIKTTEKARCPLCGAPLASFLEGFLHGLGVGLSCVAYTALRKIKSLQNKKSGI